MSTFAFTRLSNYDTSAIFKRMFPTHTANTDHLLKIREKIDSVNDSICLFDSRTTKDKYLADKAGTYSFPLTIPYEGRFIHCRVVFMHKDDIGDVEVHYFYDPTKTDIRSYVNDTWKMIHFTH
jgi:hypothetical protein